MKTFEEMKDELKSIRQDMREKSGDVKDAMTASWLSKAIALLEEMCQRLEMLEEELEEQSKAH